jgi:hypothetical protein
VPGLVARYTSSRSYLWLALLSLGCAFATGWLALRWPMAAIGAAGFLVPAILSGALALRPPIEIYETHLVIGRVAIAWRDILRVDQALWQTQWHLRLRAPLVVSLTLERDVQMLVIFSGSAEAGRSVLRHLRRYSHKAVLDGIPHRRYWGEANADRLALPAHGSHGAGRTAPVSTVVSPASSDRAPLLLPEDEAEVERLFQKLKSAGRLDTPSLPQ